MTGLYEAPGRNTAQHRSNVVPQQQRLCGQCDRTVFGPLRIPNPHARVVQGAVSVASDRSSRLQFVISTSVLSFIGYAIGLWLALDHWEGDEGLGASSRAEKLKERMKIKEAVNPASHNRATRQVLE
jgi:hypothetical protein